MSILEQEQNETPWRPIVEEGLRCSLEKPHFKKDGPLRNRVYSAAA